MKGVLHEIISPDQAGYMGQDIADAIDYDNYHNHPCLIFIADFEKVFDMVKWTF